MLILKVDGKVRFTWAKTTPSMGNCVICGAKPSEMAQRHGNFQPFIDALDYGFSNLHVKIRAFEWCCKTAIYRDIRNYQARGPDKEKTAARKSELIKEFEAELGLKVFRPCKKGGNSNNGNTARVAFNHPEIMARICHMPLSLVKGLKTMIDAIDTTSHDLNADKFEAFANAWRDEFHLSDISWNWPRFSLLENHLTFNFFF